MAYDPVALAMHVARRRYADGGAPVVDFSEADPELPPTNPMVVDKHAQLASNMDLQGAAARYRLANVWPGSEHWQANDPARPSLAHDLGRSYLGQAGAAVADLAAPAPPQSWEDLVALGLIKGYHGSPHKFDRFDIGKVGTGEGNQTYGHGLYFAENPEVAQSYKDALQSVEIGGKSMGPGDADWHFAQVAKAAGGRGITQMDADYISSNFTEAVRQGLSIDDLERNFLGSHNVQPGETGMHEAVKAVAAEARQATMRPGHIYDVDIDADPHHFLDWDKQLDEQSGHVQRALDSLNYEALPGETGSYFYRNVNRDPAAASAALREAGIRGIRYRDQGSRFSDSAEAMIGNYGSQEAALRAAEKNFKHAPLGDIRYWDKVVKELQKPMTHNYVVFDDSLLGITNTRKRGGAVMNIFRRRAEGGAVEDDGMPMPADRELPIMRPTAGFAPAYGPGEDIHPVRIPMVPAPRARVAPMNRQVRPEEYQSPGLVTRGAKAIDKGPGFYRMMTGVNAKGESIHTLYRDIDKVMHWVASSTNPADIERLIPKREEPAEKPRRRGTSSAYGRMLGGAVSDYDGELPDELEYKRGGGVTFTRALQKMLKAKGYDPGKVDGVNGPLTQSALRAFQADNGIDPSGIGDKKTIAALKAKAPPPLPRLRPSPIIREGSPRPDDLMPRDEPLGENPTPLPPPDEPFVSGDHEYDPAAMRQGRENRDFDMRRAELRSGMVSPNPNRFGPELAGYGRPSEAVPFNVGMRNLAGLPPEPPKGLDAHGMALRAMIEQDALARRGGGGDGPVVVGQGGTSIPEALDNTRSWLAKHGIINPPEEARAAPILGRPKPNFAAATEPVIDPDQGELDRALKQRALQISHEAVANRARGGHAYKPPRAGPAANPIQSAKGARKPKPGVVPYAMPKASHGRSKGHVGGLLSDVPGRTDHLPIDVPNGGYVVPADVVSSLGEGNTLAGTTKLNTLFKGFRRRPKPLSASRATSSHRGAAEGGAQEEEGDEETIPIMAAGGEYVVSPGDVLQIGEGNMRRGHNILDRFVTGQRAHTIKKLKSLPGPVKEGDR